MRRLTQGPRETAFIHLLEAGRFAAQTLDPNIIQTQTEELHKQHLDLSRYRIILAGQEARRLGMPDDLMNNAFLLGAIRYGFTSAAETEK